MRRTYYKLTITLKSPLSLGSGISDNTDSDVLLDGRGIPFIPATSVAGVIRHSLDGETADRLFGEIGEDEHASMVIVYDAVCTGKNNIAVRNSVMLLDKVAADMCKFDFEAVETGAEFTGYIELIDCGENDDNIIFEAVEKINLGLLRFGHKTSRGYGVCEVTQCLKLTFDDIDKWIYFDMFDETCWISAENMELKSDIDISRITLFLRQRGAVSVRSYVTEPSDGNETAPDYEQLSLRKGTPVIPGTSWAGAFRERFCEFTDNETCKRLFGFIEENKKDAVNKKSAIYFGESIISNAKAKTITRNSIDRYTCGTADGALYTEKTVYNGDTELDIIITEKQSAGVYSALTAVIADLDNGFLSVGGLGSVGRGLFTVEKILVNGADKTAEFKNFDFAKVTEALADV